MLVYEFKLKGKSHQYQAIDEAMRIVQFMRNKAVRYWMEHRGSGKHDLYKLAASLPQAFAFADKLNATARQQAKGLSTLKLMGKQCLNQFQDKMKRVRLVRRADGYYAQFCLDIERKEHLASTGFNHLWINSNGNTLENPSTLKRAEKALKRAQHRLSRKQKGSFNRKKQSKRLAKKHLKVHRQRKDFAKQRGCYKSHDWVVIENLQVKNMLKKHTLAKAISDASWHQLKRWLEYFSQGLGLIGTVGHTGTGHPRDVETPEERQTAA